MNKSDTNFNSQGCPFCLETVKLSFAAHQSFFKCPDRFVRCLACESVFVRSKWISSPDQEKARYETHNNQMTPEFENFLMKTVRIIQELLPDGGAVLDYGSGPEPQMMKLLEQRGYEVFGYDRYFNDRLSRPATLNEIGYFDLILMHEVFEHIESPEVDITRLRPLLKDQGQLLIVMEELPTTQLEFERWWYARDFTHIRFPSEAGLRALSERVGLAPGFRAPRFYGFLKN